VVAAYGNSDGRLDELAYAGYQYFDSAEK